MKKTALLLALALPLLVAGQQRDWANYGRYAEANAALTTAPAVVFMGNSITDGWDNAHPEFFTDNNFACRGIGGQVTSQMLCRFRADVIDIVSMAELALAAGIRPILCSVLPAAKYPWRPEIESVPEKIAALNARLQQYAAERGLTWVDYYGAMDAGDGSMRSEYTKDGVHPTPEGYTVMESVIRPALAEWLP